MEIPAKTITDMQRQVDACSAYIDALAQGCRSPEKVNTLLDAAMQKIELCCIDLRRLCERVRPTLPPLRFGSAHYHTEKIYGEVTRLDAGWLDIRLNALLPHCRVPLDQIKSKTLLMIVCAYTATFCGRSSQAITSSTVKRLLDSDWETLSLMVVLLV